MAISGAYRSNPIRMMGMASGMDTQSIIDATLRMHQFKIDQQMRNRQLIEWKQKTHNDIKNQITSLKNTYLSNLGSKTMMNRNTFNTNIAKASSSAVSVSATVNAGVGNLTINSITRLAQNAAISSSGKVANTNDGFTTGSTLGSLVFAGNEQISFDNYRAFVTNDSGKRVEYSQDDFEDLKADMSNWSDEFTSVKVNGNTLKITRNDSGEYVWEMRNADQKEDDPPTIQGYFDAADFEDAPLELNILGIGKVTVTDNGGKVHLAIQEDTPEGRDLFRGELSFTRETEVDLGADGKVKFTMDEGGTVRNSGSTLSFFGDTDLIINGQAVNVRSNMSISEMLNKVNTEVTSVTMSYDRMNDKFTITNKSNSDTTLNVTDKAGGNIKELLFGASPSTVTAQTAQVKINGEDLEFESNSFSFRGVSITLRETSSEAITVSVSRDTDKAVDAIKDFIDSYNSLIAKLEGLLSERKTSQERSYTPLTDEEKATMTEKQIEEWEAIAKKGILRNDRAIENLVSSLRSTFFQQIEGTGLSASQIGRSTGSYFDGTGGQIIVNEDRLRAALEADPDRVADVFIKIDNSDGLKGVGLMHKIDNILTDFTRINGAQDNTLTALEKSYNEMNERIAKLEERMWAEEDKLYRQFAAMETAMSQMQQQGSWFQSMLGGA